MMASTPSPMRPVGGDAGDVGAGVARVTLRVLDWCAEHAASGVDLVDGELDTGELGWSEEGKAAGLREQRADLQHAVAFALDADRDLLDDRRLGRLGLNELFERLVEAVVGAELEDRVAPGQRLAVAVEVERTGDAVVVDVAAGVDDREAVGERRALLAVAR